MLYVVWDERTLYALMSARDRELQPAGANTLLYWEAIRLAAEVSRVFDFEGSMVEPIEHYFRGFGGRQTPYFCITKAGLQGRGPRSPPGRRARRSGAGTPPCLGRPRWPGTAVGSSRSRALRSVPSGLPPWGCSPSTGRPRPRRCDAPRPHRPLRLARGHGDQDDGTARRPHALRTPGDGVHRRRARPPAPCARCAVGVLLVGAGVTTHALKHLLAEPRYADWLGFRDQIEAVSWPSGHGTAAMTLALCAVLVSAPA